MLHRLNAARNALKLGFFASSLTIASLGARLAAADISPDAGARAFGVSVAHEIGDDISNKALERVFGGRSAIASLAGPPFGARASTPDILAGYEKGPPLANLSLPPQDAQAVNEAVPFDVGPNPPAKPFILREPGKDRDLALTCLTDAVYYEAGFEPIEGAQAVAQVVLNRVRHPIFPKTVCGVVFQGSELKTGCQFSFTCDGSMSRTPAAAAWARSQAVAERALNGFVQKTVGEATHYHTQWVVPWWSPSVSKVAAVGVQIFYRWPGALGAPAAFTGRYAGSESIPTRAAASPAGTAQGAAAPPPGVPTVLASEAAATIEPQAPAKLLAAAPTPEAPELRGDAPDLKARYSASTFFSAPAMNCGAAGCKPW